MNKKIIELWHAKILYLLNNLGSGTPLRGCERLNQLFQETVRTFSSFVRDVTILKTLKGDLQDGIHQI
jgi:hypothetical protein